MSPGAAPSKRRALSKRALRDALSAKAVMSARHFGEAAERGQHQRVWGPARRVEDAIARAGVQIHAIGIGRKMVANQYTNVPSVRVYVTHKLPTALLPTAARIPDMIDGVPTDVIESPPAFLAAPALPVCSALRGERQRPVQGGISGASELINAGTLGALCRSTRAGEEGRRFVLGNNHTLADLGAAPVGSAILQPSRRDFGTIDDRIASLSRFVPILENGTASNLVDAAIAELDATIEMQSQICSIGTPSGINEAALDMVVQKHGRTSGPTLGVIDDPSVDIVIPLSRANPQRVARFVRQIRIRPAPAKPLFAQGGDSGALVMSRSKGSAVGLLFACPDDGSFAYANPISEVLKALEIALV